VSLSEALQIRKRKTKVDMVNCTEPDPRSSMEERLQQLRNILLFLRRDGVVLCILGWTFSFLLAGIEYCLAAFLLVFLFTLKIIDTPQIPSWIPFDLRSLSAAAVWGTLLLVGILQALFQIVVYQSKIMLTEGAHARMRMVLAYRILRSGDSLNMPLSEMNLYTAEFFPKATSFIFHFTQLIAFFIQTATVAAGMLFLAPGEAVIGGAGLGLMACIVLCLNRMTTSAAGRIPKARESLEQSKVRITRNWLLIKILRIQEREYEQYLNSVLSYYKHSSTAYFFANLGGASMPVLGIVVIATMVLASLHCFHTPTANLLAFLFLFVRFEQMVANGSHLIGGLFICFDQARKTARLIFSLSPEQLKEALAPAKGLTLSGESIRMEGSQRWQYLEGSPAETECGGPPAVDVDNLCFTWPGRESPLFENLSFTVQPGSQLGIVGPNGCGKSTLLSIILGALHPSEGLVCIGGLRSAAYVEQSSDALAYVGPEPYLIHGTIRDNLLYGTRREHKGDEIQRALKMVRLDEFVRKIPGGIEYMIQENGDGLSSGQKQRLTIARALLRRPSLLVMDEPSANLDEAIEARILQILRELNGRCTVVIVSHKPGILLEADRILNLADFRFRSVS